jgi:hypothetical protein
MGTLVPGETGPYLQRARSLESIQGVPLDNIEPDQLLPSIRVTTQFWIRIKYLAVKGNKIQSDVILVSCNLI